MIYVVGAGLPGLAASARLAAAGHQVTILEAGRRIGEDLPVATESGETVLTGTQTWRELFAATGTDLNTALAARGLRLVPAPPKRYRFADGSSLELPSDRAGQYESMATAFGVAAATAWQDLLDRLTDVQVVVHGIGINWPFVRPRLTASERSVLQPNRTVAELAATLPQDELSEIVLGVAAWLGQDPRRLPAWHAFRLAGERSFGRWQLLDAAAAIQPAATLGAILIERLDALGVQLRTNTEVRSLRTGPRVVTVEDSFEAAAVISTVNPFCQAELTRERADQKIARQSYRGAADGPLWRGWRTLLELPRLEPSLPRVLVASPWSPGGTDSWAQLATGALAAYQVHFELTGTSLRDPDR